MYKVLFLIHDLGPGGAEKVLVNLVNHIDPSKFNITVMVLFGGGVNEQFLAPHITLCKVFSRSVPGNSKLFKLLSPAQLHRLLVKEHYDIEVSYLEGPSARIISGCSDASTKLVSWIHVEQHTMKTLSAAFRSPSEALACYRRFHRTVCVSRFVKDDFTSLVPLENPCIVLYNTVESGKIRAASQMPVPQLFDTADYKLVAVGKLKPAKGFDRLVRILAQLRQEDIPAQLYLLGEGPCRLQLEQQCKELGVQNAVHLLGYETNPYKYVSKCDLFLCASFAEGFSTAATEALIVGTPVCTVDVSGMREMLGENNEYGIVTLNDEHALYSAVKSLLTNPHELTAYKLAAQERGSFFNTESTVAAVETMLTELN